MDASQGVEVNVRQAVGNRGDDSNLVIVLAVETVRDDVVHTRYVSQLCTKFADQSKLITLAVGRWVTQLEECSRQWLLVREHCEFPAFQKVPKMDYGRIKGKQLEVVGGIA